MVMNPLSLYGLSSPVNKVFAVSISLSVSKVELYKEHDRIWLQKISIPQNSVLLQNQQVLGASHTAFCNARDVSEDNEELELHDKPSPVTVNVGGATTEVINEPTKPDNDEALEPFLKYFKSKELEEKEAKEDLVDDETVSKKIHAEYYEPKPGDWVVGVVVSGNENRLDISIGAKLLATMLTKEVLPLYDKEMDYLICDLNKNAEEFMANGKMGVIQKHDSISRKPKSGRPIVDAGNVVFAEVLCRTLSGRALLSSRRYFRRIAWYRVRQIEQLGEPIQVRITEWNTGGVLTRIEGLRAFLPKTELVDKVHSFADLKKKVGSNMYVLIKLIDEANNDLILSEQDAWEKVYLREGTLLEGTVRKIFPYGAQVGLGQTKRSGLLHMSNISFGKFKLVSDLLEVGEKVKVLVIKSLLPDKISLSIAELESEPGLFISDKEKVYEEAEEMARRYREKHPVADEDVSSIRKSEPHMPTIQSFEDEESLYANWTWFLFQR